MTTAHRPTLLDVCSGGGGLALGLEQAGFTPILLLDKLKAACETLRLNRPDWDVRELDLREFVAEEHRQVYDIDLLSAGLPRVVATASRKYVGDDEIRLVKDTMMLLHGVQPRAVLIENVPDLVTNDRYEGVRNFMQKELAHLEYRYRWFVINAADYGVPQDRRQGILVAFKGDLVDSFKVPDPFPGERLRVGEALYDSMASRGWPQVAEWAAQADRVAPTLVGGSDRRGGADLGPSGSKAAWARMGVNGGSLGDALPGPDFRWDPNRGAAGMVKLTVEQAARLQAFPDDWQFSGRKTARYRQVGHASPPPVGRVLGEAIRTALEAG